MKINRVVNIFSGLYLHNLPRRDKTLFRISKLFGSILSIIVSKFNNFGSSLKYFSRAVIEAFLTFSFKSVNPSKNGDNGILYFLKFPIWLKTSKTEALTSLLGSFIKGESIDINFLSISFTL